MFYGWVIVIAGFAANSTLGETFWSFGVFFPPLEAEFGWSRAQLSSAYTLFLLGYALSAFITGRLADRYNPRPILFISGIIAGVGISLCSQVDTITQLRLFFILAGLGAGATITIPLSTVQRWFFGRQRQGLALSIVTAGVGIGAIVFAPLTDYFILHFGWRQAFIVVGIIFFIVITISSLFIKQKPDRPSPFYQSIEEESDSQILKGWPTGKVISSVQFWAIVFIVCVGSFSFNVLSVHLVPYSIDLGISSTAAAAAIGLMGGFSVPGRLLSGIISDKIGWHRTLVIAIVGSSLSITLLLFLKQLWLLYLFVLVCGLFHGGRVTAYIGLLGKAFGMRSVAEIIGIVQGLGALVGAVGPFVAGFIFDLTQSYYTIFVAIIITLAIGGLLALKLKSVVIEPT